MFDRFVSGSRSGWKRRAVLVASLALHGAVAVALIVASVFHVAEIAPPPLAIVFFSAPPPASSPSPSPPKPPHPTKRQTHTPSTVVQPPTADATPPGERDSVGPPGPPDGPPGPPDAPPSIGPPGPPAPSAPAPRPRNIAPHALDAQKLSGALPHLPAAVQSARRGLGDTSFVARVCVDQQGAVSSVSVLQTIPGAEEEIVRTLRSWRYKPQPIPVCFISQLVFNVE